VKINEENISGITIDSSPTFAQPTLSYQAVLLKGLWQTYSFSN